MIQETEAQLGDLDAESRARARTLARQMTARRDPADFFEDPASAEATASKM